MMRYTRMYVYGNFRIFFLFLLHKFSNLTHERMIRENFLYLKYFSNLAKIVLRGYKTYVR